MNKNILEFSSQQYSDGSKLKKIKLKYAPKGWCETLDRNYREIDYRVVFYCSIECDPINNTRVTFYISEFGNPSVAICQLRALS